MKLDKCLQLAEAAANDPSLIENHCRPKGVDYYIRLHIAEVDLLLSAVHDDEALISQLRSEQSALNAALKVYEPHSGS